MRFTHHTRRSILDLQYDQARRINDVDVMSRIKKYRTSLAAGTRDRSRVYTHILGPIVGNSVVVDQHQWSFPYDERSLTLTIGDLVEHPGWNPNKRLDDDEVQVSEYEYSIPTISYAHRGLSRLTKIPSNYLLKYDGTELKSQAALIFKGNHLSSLNGLECDTVNVADLGDNGIISFANQRNLPPLHGAPNLHASIIDLSFNRLTSLSTTAKFQCQQLWLLDCDLTDVSGISRLLTTCTSLFLYTTEILNGTEELFLIDGLTEVVTANERYDAIVTHNLKLVANNSVTRRQAMLRCQRALDQL